MPWGDEGIVEVCGHSTSLFWYLLNLKGMCFRSRVVCFFGDAAIGMEEALAIVEDSLTPRGLSCYNIQMEKPWLPEIELCVSSALKRHLGCEDEVGGCKRAWRVPRTESHRFRPREGRHRANVPYDGGIDIKKAN